MKIIDIRQLSPTEISKEIAKNKHELLKMKLQTGISQSKETHKLRDLRKLIARLQTIKQELSKSAN